MATRKHIQVTTIFEDPHGILVDKRQRAERRADEFIEKLEAFVVARRAYDKQDAEWCNPRDLDNAREELREQLIKVLP